MNPLQILILDFGSQYTQLIARRIRELHIYCEIHPFHHIPSPDALKGLKGIILSGSPCSVRDADAPTVALEQWIGKLPILGICYGAQLMAQQLGGLVMASENREYGRAYLKNTSASALLSGIEGESQVWMSHADTIQQLPQGAKILATTESIPVAAYQLEGSATYGIQFHPEVTHTTEGKTLFKNFVIDICGAVPNWTPASFIEQSVQQIQSEVGSQEKVVLGLSGGVDSSVAALLLHKAIGTRLYCIFVDSGLLRKNEYEEVLHSYQDLGLNVIGVNAKDVFFEALQSLSDPEAKRKAIGKTFIEVFDREAHQISDVKWLAQGTIYPDVIESVSVKGPSVTIKSHHNVGGLPEKMNLKVIEPLRSLFKDEVREVGKALGLPTPILHRHPFPGPGLAIRIIGDITPQKVAILQEADHIYIQNLRESGWYDKIWQAGAILLNTQSVGVMGDERTYENVVALRAVTSTDGMTADWVHIPYELLAKISNEIINRVKGVNRVVYDISSKPPATIEWE